MKQLKGDLRGDSDKAAEPISYNEYERRYGRDGRAAPTIRYGRDGRNTEGRQTVVASDTADAA